MARDPSGLLLAAAIVVFCGSVEAQQSAGALTLDRALAIARERGPLVLAARLRVEEARGRLAAASVRLRENPVIDAAAGQRGSGDDAEELELGLMQTFETGGRREARIASASASVERAAVNAEAAELALTREVAMRFYGALHATEHVRLATDTERLSRQALRTAERRNELGEVPLLDVHVARVGWAGDLSAIEAAEARARAALGGLRLLLGIGAAEPLEVVGELDGVPGFDLPALLAEAGNRPELRALSAELREAEADIRLSQGHGWPDLGFGIRYEREEGEDIVMGAMSIALPVSGRGQGLRAEASARSRRLQVELDAARRSAEIEVRTAFEAWQRRMNAVDAIRQEGLVSMEETERLAQRAYETGAFSIGELLLLRRETVETRRQYLDRLFDAALAASELQTAAGVMPDASRASRE